MEWKIRVLPFVVMQSYVGVVGKLDIRSGLQIKWFRFNNK